MSHEHLFFTTYSCSSTISTKNSGYWVDSYGIFSNLKEKDRFRFASNHNGIFAIKASGKSLLKSFSTLKRDDAQIMLIFIRSPSSLDKKNQPIILEHCKAIILFKRHIFSRCTEHKPYSYI